MDVREYLTSDGHSPFAAWFGELDAQAGAKITVAVTRIGQGNLSNAKSVGGSVYEFRMNVGPGYRIYFARDGETIVILLGGGTKRRQQRDTEDAHARWQNYRDRKKGEM
jgi:putative addiction module killer protein